MDELYFILKTHVSIFFLPPINFMG